MAEIKKEAEIELIPLRKLKPLPIQLGVIDHETEAMLREDMRKTKRIDPVWVRSLTIEEKEECKAKYPQAEFEIIDGHKRFRNAELLHWETVPAIVFDVSREEAYTIAYRKNKERGAVDPMLEALYFKHLYIDLKLPAHKIAEMFDINEKYVYNVLKRVQIQPEATREIVRQTAIAKPLTGKHLEAIASAPPEVQLPLTKKVIEEHLSAKEAKIIAKAATAKPTILELPKPKLVEQAKKIVTPPPPPPKPIDEIALTELKKDYPTIIVDYVYTRYRGEFLKDVIKAAIWITWWKRLTEAEREEITREAIRMAGERGFKEPIIG
jgi:ParB family chromosome partitioning protein